MSRKNFEGVPFIPTLCPSCLNNHVSKANSSQLKCPVCQTAFALGGPSSSPPDTTTVGEILELVPPLEEPTVIRQGDDGVDATSLDAKHQHVSLDCTMYCMQCHVPLCSKCLTSDKTHHGHDLEDMDKAILKMKIMFKYANTTYKKIAKDGSFGVRKAISEINQHQAEACKKMERRIRKKVDTIVEKSKSQIISKYSETLKPLNDFKEQSAEIKSVLDVLGRSDLDIHEGHFRQINDIAFKLQMLSKICEPVKRNSVYQGKLESGIPLIIMIDSQATKTIRAGLGELRERSPQVQLSEGGDEQPKLDTRSPSSPRKKSLISSSTIHALAAAASAAATKTTTYTQATVVEEEEAETAATEEAAAAEAELRPPRNCHIKRWPEFQGYGFNVFSKSLCKGKHGELLFRIKNVRDGSPAEAVGLVEGDLIQEINGQDLLTVTQAQVVQKIQSDPEKCSILVVDDNTKEYYESRGISLASWMPMVKNVYCPDTQELYAAEKSFGKGLLGTYTIRVSF